MSKRSMVDIPVGVERAQIVEKLTLAFLNSKTTQELKRSVGAISRDCDVQQTSALNTLAKLVLNRQLGWAEMFPLLKEGEKFFGLDLDERFRCPSEQETVEAVLEASHRYFNNRDKEKRAQEMIMGLIG